MNASAEKISEITSMSKPMQISGFGKIKEYRRYEQKWYTKIVIPAPDAYSKPAVIEIRSAFKLGDRDEEIKFKAILGGFEGKPYKFVDKETGETRIVQNVTHVLDAVE